MFLVRKVDNFEGQQDSESAFDLVGGLESANRDAGVGARPSTEMDTGSSMIQSRTHGLFGEEME